MFFANGGGPDVDTSPPETVPLEEAVEFQTVLVNDGFFQAVDMDLCVVDTQKHSTEYEDLSCEDHPVPDTVFSSTISFMNTFVGP